MSIEPKSYVFQTEAGGWRVVGTRVCVDSVIHSYWNGDAPETIARNFSSLNYELVHGVVATYLANKEFFDKYLEAQQRLWDEAIKRQEENPSPVGKRIRDLMKERAEKQ
jgi:uncharacterized protein (DUF433 family)